MRIVDEVFSVDREGYEVRGRGENDAANQRTPKFVGYFGGGAPVCGQREDAAGIV